MAWRRPGDKPLSEAMMVNSPTHTCVTRPQWVKLILYPIVSSFHPCTCLDSTLWRLSLMPFGMDYENAPIHPMNGMKFCYIALNKERCCCGTFWMCYFENIAWKHVGINVIKTFVANLTSQGFRYFRWRISRYKIYRWWIPNPPRYTVVDLETDFANAFPAATIFATGKSFAYSTTDTRWHLKLWWFYGVFAQGRYFHG